MDIFFTDPNEIPLPPENVRIRELSAEPWPDGQKVRVYLETDPSQKRPSAELTIIDPQGEPISTISIVESMTRKIEVNMHIRSSPMAGDYTLAVSLYFDQIHSETDQEKIPQITHLVTDSAQVTFQFTNQQDDNLL
jgi:hypothetical protein